MTDLGRMRAEVEKVAGIEAGPFVGLALIALLEALDEY